MWSSVRIELLLPENQYRSCDVQGLRGGRAKRVQTGGFKTGMKMNGQKVKEIRQAKGLTQEELAERADISLRTMASIETEDERDFSNKTVRLIAETLKVKPWEISDAAKEFEQEQPQSQAVECIVLKINHESMKTWSDAKRATLLEGIRLILSVGPAVKLLSETEGCVKITVQVTAEQAEALKRAFEEGKLDALGVSELRSVPPPVVRPPYWKRLNYRRILGGASIACSLAGVVPVWAPPAYVCGLALAALSGGLAYTARDIAVARSKYVLPAVGLLLNSIALVCWPTAIGFFKTERGYRFGVETRRAETGKEPQAVEWQPQVIERLVAPSRLKKGDKVTMTAQGAILLEFTESGDAGDGSGNHLADLPNNYRRVKIEIRHNDQLVFSEDIDLHAGRHTVSVEKTKDGNYQLKISESIDSK